MRAAGAAVRLVRAPQLKFPLLPGPGSAALCATPQIARAAPFLQVPVNGSLPELTLHFELSTVAAWKHLLMSQMEQSFSMQRDWGAMGDGESDEVRAALRCATLCRAVP